MTAAPGARPIFVGGCGRSGTTLAVDLLGMHSRLSPIYETKFVVELPPLLFRDSGLARSVVADRIRGTMADWARDLPQLPHEKKGYERYWHGPHYVRFDRGFALARTEALIERYLAADADAEAGFRDFLRSLFAEHARLDGKPGWINKTPRYVLMLGTLQHLFPDMIYIDCVRDPRDAVASMLSRSWGPKTAEKGARFWLACVEKSAAFRAHAPDRHIEIRYEALLAEPRTVLARALERLGLEDETAAMLARYRERVELKPGGDAARDPTIAGPVEAIAGAAMARLGYG
jgi:hypothetical protein